MISVQKQQAVKKGAAPKCQGEKRCEIKGDDQEMAVIIVQWQSFYVIKAIQVNLVPSSSETWKTHKFTRIVIIKIFVIKLLSQPFLAAIFDFTSFFTLACGATPLFTAYCSI